MAEKHSTLMNCAPDFRESVCIHTSKIFDSCKDKDCVEDLRVYPTLCSQEIIDNSFSIRPRTARLLYADVRVDEINFNRGCYTVDVTYFYEVTGEAFPNERTVNGLAVFDKRVILYGSEGSSRVFTSRSDGITTRSNSMPIAVVEAVDPLPLSMKIVNSDCCCERDCCHEIPEHICCAFAEELVTERTDRQLHVSLGQFSIIRLERDTQLLIPVYDYCLPHKECGGGAEDDPCSIFSGVPFPVDDFFPPNSTKGHSCACN